MPGCAQTSLRWCVVAWTVIAGQSLLSGCGTQPIARTEGHLRTDATTAPAAKPSAPPPIVAAVPLPPPPQPRTPDIRYSVVVVNEQVQNVLFAIARDTKVNIDVHPAIEGRVSINAIDQTLTQILTRIARQVDMRWEVSTAGGSETLVVVPDSPYLKNYTVDYVNLARDTTGTVAVTTQIVGTQASVGGASVLQGNNSTLALKNEAKNRFWETLVQNVKDLLRETDKILPEGSQEIVTQSRGQQQASTTRGEQRRAASTRATTARGVTTQVGPGETASESESQTVESRLTFREAASVIANAETGTISVRATARQHEKVAEFLAQVSSSAKRQVLIEATVVEVVLNDQYQSGVDWSALARNGLGYTIRQNFLGGNLSEPPVFTAQYDNSARDGRAIQTTVKLLNSFGETRILSSPKLMALNNQTAVLKVVDNVVYFTVKVNTTALSQNQTQVTYETLQNSVPIGLVMTLTPQIGETDVVTLSVRPSISRVTGFVDDPNPELARAQVKSRIPQIQTREMESVMRVASGQTAILGGLMQDSLETSRDGLPVLSRVPLVGDAVSYRNDRGRKTELVIFMRPLVVKDANVATDLADYKRFLPDNEFFRDPSPVLDVTSRGSAPEPAKKP